MLDGFHDCKPLAEAGIDVVYDFDSAQSCF